MSLFSLFPQKENQPQKDLDLLSAYKNRDLNDKRMEVQQNMSSDEMADYLSKRLMKVVSKELETY